jgi:hypothetical protein
MREKLQLTVTYLQKLGEEYLDQVFKSARWVFQQDQNIASEVRSTSWPVLKVAPSPNFSLYRSFSLRMSNFPDPRLRTSSKPSTPGSVPGSSSILSKRREKILLFAITDLQSCTLRWRFPVEVHPLEVLLPATEKDRMFGLLPSEGDRGISEVSQWVDRPRFTGFFEGRMGRHESALEIYAYMLHDYLKAEE